MAIQTLNPYTEKVEKRFKSISAKEVEKKILLTQKAFEKWKNVSLDKRAMYLRKVAKLLLRNKEVYARTIVTEMGKPISEAISEIEKCALNCNYYADNAKKFMEAEIHNTEFKHARIEYEPMGVILGVMPWNFPFWQVFRFAAPALMAGNGIVLKHAANVPQSALLIQKIFEESGLPKNLFTTLLIESSMVESVIRNKFVKAVTLTGSEAAGSKVASIAGSEIKKVVLELGGSDPFIILKDADLEKAIKAAVQSRMPNAGQVCVSGKRLIIDKSLIPRARKLLVEEVSNLPIGNPMHPKTKVGPLAKADIRDEVASQVDKSIERGAVCIYGGKKMFGEGFYFVPTILVNVKKGMPAFDEEIFGPVISVIASKNEEHAVKLANDHVYGLGAAVWSKNEKRAFKVARQVEAGIVAINGIAKSDPRFPFGGTKKSGFGRELGSHGLKEFMNVKTIIAS